MGAGRSHVFSEMFVHVNWHCHRNKRLITPQIGPDLHEFIQIYCKKTKGVHFNEIGGIEDHVHLVFQFEPFVILSDFIGKVKGASSHEMNQRYGAGAMDWQRGYGIVTFSKRHLSWIVKYVQNQKQHHQDGTTNEMLERYEDIPGDDSGPTDDDC